MRNSFFNNSELARLIITCSITATLFSCTNNDIILKQELVNSGNIYHFDSKPFSGTALNYGLQGEIQQKIELKEGKISTLINYKNDGSIVDSITVGLDGKIEHAYRCFRGINYHDSWNYSADVSYPKSDYDRLAQINYIDDLPVKFNSDFIQNELNKSNASQAQLSYSNAVGRVWDKFLFNYTDGDDFFEFITNIPRRQNFDSFDLQFCCQLCGEHDGGSYQETIATLVISPRLIEGYFADYQLKVLYTDGQKEIYYISDFNTFPIGVTDYIIDSVDAVGNLHFLAGFSNDGALNNDNLESSKNTLYLKVDKDAGDISGVIELNGISEHITLCTSRMELTQGYDRLYSDYMVIHKRLRRIFY